MTPQPKHPAEHLDEMIAAVGLIQRCGAKNFEVGYQDETENSADADWYAHAQFRGARVIVEHHIGPVEATEALAFRLMDGGRCRRCGLEIRFGPGIGGCHWYRLGDTWRAGCDKPIDLSIKHPFEKKK